VLNEAIWAEIVLVLDWSGIEIGTPLTMIHCCCSSSSAIELEPTEVERRRKK
jgi:hypothetical protein